jgi:cobalt-zinc-cadmium efflux system outer membrane protein
MIRKSFSAFVVLALSLPASALAQGGPAKDAAEKPRAEPAAIPAPAAPATSAGTAAASSTAKTELPGAGDTPISLVEAIDKFRRQNLELAAQRYDVSATRADILGAGLWSNPQVSATGAFLAHGIPSGGKQELYLTVTQNAPIAGHLGLRRDAARGFSSAAERDFSAAAWQLLSDVRLAYLNLQIAQARYRVIVTASRDLERVQNIISERVTAGANAPYDRVRVGVERSELFARQTEAETDIYAARAALAQAIGKDVRALSLVAEELAEDPRDLPADPTPLVEAALGRRAEVQAAKARATASDLRTEAAKRSVVPSPDVSLGYSHFFNIPDSATTTASGGAVSVGLSVPIPLFDRGQGTIGRSQADAEAQRLRGQQVEVTVKREVEAAHAAALARVGAWKRFRDTVAPDVERMRQMAELAYREGRANVLELLDAYSTYVEARARAIELRGGALRGHLQLERALGPSRPDDVPPL